MKLSHRGIALIIVVVAGVVTRLANGQELPSWDEPRNYYIESLAFNGEHVVAGEVLIVLRHAEALEELSNAAVIAGDRVAGFIPRLGIARVVLTAGSSLEKRLEEYGKLDFVNNATPNHIATVSISPTLPPAPNDPGFPSQWHLENTGQSGGTADADIDASEAWLITDGSPAVIVAVIDTGIVVDHPEFSGRLLQGWDFIDEDADPNAIIKHGVWVAGILGAVANNGFEVVGVDQRCMILPVKVGGNLIDEFDAAQGFDFAASKGVDVINASFMANWDPVVLSIAVAAAAKAGVIIVAAAGNTGTLGKADKTWPAAYASTLSIGWTDHDDWRYSQSAAGETLDFVAPGANVVSVSNTGSGQQTESLYGSSFAAPMVSGVVALMKSLNRSLNYDQVYDLLVAGAEDQLGDPLDTPGWDPWYGHGRVNARASLEALCGCQGGEPLIASPQHVPATTGGVVELVIDFGRNFAHQAYLVLGSASSGGYFPFAGATLRLTPDEYLQKTLAGPDGASLIDTSGILDANGQAHAMIVLDSLTLGTTDLQLFHQAVVFHQGRPAQVAALSNKTITVVEGNY